MGIPSPDHTLSRLQSYQIPYIETSAKTGRNVEAVFLRAAEELAAGKAGPKADDAVHLNEAAAQASWCSYGASYCYKS